MQSVTVVSLRPRCEGIYVVTRCTRTPDLTGRGYYECIPQNSTLTVLKAPVTSTAVWLDATNNGEDCGRHVFGGVRVQAWTQTLV